MENEEMQRVKYQGVTITHYKRAGTLCIQGKEADVMKIKAQQTDEGNEAEEEGEKEEREIRKIEREKGKERERDKQKAHRYERRRRKRSQKAGRDESWNKHNNKPLHQGGKRDPREHQQGTEEQRRGREEGGHRQRHESRGKTNDTRKREREDEESTIDNISFDLDTM